MIAVKPLSKRSFIRLRIMHAVSTASQPAARKGSPAEPRLRRGEATIPRLPGVGLQGRGAQRAQVRGGMQWRFGLGLQRPEIDVVDQFAHDKAR